MNGIAERWVGICRRELLDLIIAVDERHLKRLLSEYVGYYHDDRTHLGLAVGHEAALLDAAERNAVTFREREPPD
jgi:hypothetical protein